MKNAQKYRNFVVIFKVSYFVVEISQQSEFILQTSAQAEISELEVVGETQDRNVSGRNEAQQVPIISDVNVATSGNDFSNIETFTYPADTENR